MVYGVFLVKSGGNVNRRGNTCLLAGFKLCGKQVEMQSRVHFIGFGRKVSPTVMALCKQGNRIDMPLF